MISKLYKRSEHETEMCRVSRPVEPVAQYHDEVLQDFAAPSTACVAGADFLLEELEETDPDLDERCGLLDNRFELYALRVPKCPHLALVVSLDTGQDRPWPCTLHGLLSRRSRPCEAGRHRAAKHFNLIDPSWEPANDQDKL